MVSHEMKTPTWRSGICDLMLAGVTGVVATAGARKRFRVIRKMGRLIQDLTYFSRIEMASCKHLSPTALGAVVVRRRQTTQTAYAAKQTVLYSDLPVDLPLVLGRLQRLVQVMTTAE